MKRRLSDRVSLSVLARAESEADRHEDLGCSIQGPTAHAVREAHLWLKRQIAKAPPRSAREAVALVKRLEATPRYRALCTGKTSRGRKVLRDEVLFPDPLALPPRFLHLREGERGFDVPVAKAGWPAVHGFFGALQRGVTVAGLKKLVQRSAPVAELFEGLEEAGLLVRHLGALPIAPASLTFIGHHTFLFSGRKARVLVDPYFRPASVFDLPTYRPLQLADLPPVDAVVITHTHGDHFHLGSLVGLPRDTRFFVPVVLRESIFSTDCVTRLEQLGFTRVEALPWGESRKVGDVEVRALPFFGEQPTDGPGVYPGLLNHGNTWALRTRGLSAAFFADAGRDVRGDMAPVAAELGGIDVLCTGIRGFKLRPVHYGYSTLDAFLVGVPAADLFKPQQLMADPEDALAWADLAGARRVVPCADGGAPWYWREGMGPRYPGYPGDLVEGAQRHDENPAADPYPERLLEARQLQPGPSLPTVMRPGQVLKGDAVRALPGFEWPFGKQA